MQRLSTPLDYATALAELPPECRPLGLRIVPAGIRALVEYMVLIYIPTLRRLRRANEAKARAGYFVPRGSGAPAANPASSIRPEGGPPTAIAAASRRGSGAPAANPRGNSARGRP
jgi:hypothetical protein